MHMRNYQAKYRIARVIMYFCLVVAGVIALNNPSDLVRDQVRGIVVLSWAIGLTVSSIACLFGAITDRWIGEYAGLPLLFSCLAMYGFSVMLAATSEYRAPLAIGLLILGLSSGLLAHWQDVRDIKRLSYAVRELNKADEG